MFDDSRAFIENVYEAVDDGDVDIDTTVTRRQVGKGAAVTLLGIDMFGGDRHALRPLRWGWDNTAGKYEIRRRDRTNGNSEDKLREPNLRILNPEDNQVFSEGDTINFDVHVNTFDEDANVLLEYGGQTDSEHLNAGESELYQRALDDVLAGEIDFGVTVETPSYELSDSVTAVVEELEGEFGEICQAYGDQNHRARRDLENAIGRYKSQSVFDDLDVTQHQAGYFLRDRDRNADVQPIKLDGAPSDRTDVAGFDSSFAELMYNTAQTNRTQLLRELDNIYEGNCN